jgi:hypothetical protein
MGNIVQDAVDLALSIAAQAEDNPERAKCIFGKMAIDKAVNIAEQINQSKGGIKILEAKASRRVLKGLAEDSEIIKEIAGGMGKDILFQNGITISAKEVPGLTDYVELDLKTLIVNI